MEAKEKLKHYVNIKMNIFARIQILILFQMIFFFIFFSIVILPREAQGKYTGLKDVVLMFYDGGDIDGDGYSDSIMDMAMTNGMVIMEQFHH